MRSSLLGLMVPSPSSAKTPNRGPGTLSVAESGTRTPSLENRLRDIRSYPVIARLAAFRAGWGRAVWGRTVGARGDRGPARGRLSIRAKPEVLGGAHPVVDRVGLHCPPAVEDQRTPGSQDHQPGANR